MPLILYYRTEEIPHQTHWSDKPAVSGHLGLTEDLPEGDDKRHTGVGDRYLLHGQILLGTCDQIHDAIRTIDERNSAAILEQMKSRSQNVFQSAFDFMPCNGL